MAAPELLGIIGSGLIGTDPWDSRAWSGISPYFFGELRRRGVLKEAWGFELPKYHKGYLAIRNFSRDGERWRRQLYMDLRYRDALTRKVSAKLKASPLHGSIVQIGAMFNLRGAVGDAHRIYSYIDGNFSISSRSPYFPKGISPKRIQDALQFERRVYEQLDLIFVMSEYLRRSFIDDYGISPERVVDVGAGFNMPALPDVSQLHQRSYQRQSLLFIGEEFARKGGAQLLQAFGLARRRFPSATLHIVGPPRPPSGMSGVDGVTWHGFLRKRDPAEFDQFCQLLSQASLFVLPSLYEPFGIAPLEAMAHGVPCLVSDDWALCETVQDQVCGRTARVGDVQHLAELMVEMLGSPELLREYGLAARKRVETLYTWNAVADRLLGQIEAYESRGS